MFLALNEACFSVVALFSASLCLYGLERDPVWSGPRRHLRSPPCFGSMKPKKKKKLWSCHLSGFTPCHCVCIWTVPTFDCILKHKTFHPFRLQLCFLKRRPSRVETGCLTSSLWVFPEWDSTTVLTRRRTPVYQGFLSARGAKHTEPWKRVCKVLSPHVSLRSSLLVEGVLASEMK